MEGITEAVPEKRMVLPKYVSWAITSFMCSLFLAVPLVLTFLIVSVLTCANDLILRGTWVWPDAVTETCGANYVWLLAAVVAYITAAVWPNKPWTNFSWAFVPLMDLFQFRLFVNKSLFLPNETYLVAGFPHGIVPLGSLLAAAFNKLNIPELDGSPCCASILLRLPVIRQMMLWLGSISATRKKMINELKSGTNCLLLPGGIAEIFLSSRKRESIFINKRHGFITAAQEAGASIVPGYLFGHTRIFDQPFQTTESQEQAMWLSRKLKVCLVWFWGHLLLPIPFLHPITVVIGRPIPTRIGDEIRPTEELHTEYVAQIKEIFEAYKERCGYGDAQLHLM